MSTAASTTNSDEAVKQFLAAAAASADVGPEPRPEFNGLLVQVTGLPQVYLVINGYRRWIPNWDTFLNLFPSNASIKNDTGVILIAQGPDLSNGAVLAKSSADAKTYLVSNGMKMWIPNPTIFRRYQFNGSKVLTVAPVIMDAVPTGPDIQGPPQ